MLIVFDSNYSATLLFVGNKLAHQASAGGEIRGMSTFLVVLCRFCLLMPDNHKFSWATNIWTRGCPGATSRCDDLTNTESIDISC